MSKKKALIILTFINFLALLALWWGYSEFNKVFAGVAKFSDTVSINNRIGFFLVGIGVPIGYIFALCDYFFLHNYFKKKAAWVNWGFIILGIVLFTSAIVVSAYMRTYVERAGYLHCPEADKRMSFTTYLMYTKNYDICSRLVEGKEKNRAERR